MRFVPHSDECSGGNGGTSTLPDRSWKGASSGHCGDRTPPGPDRSLCEVVLERARTSGAIESDSQRTPLRAFLPHGLLGSRQVANAVLNVSDNVEFSHSLADVQRSGAAGERRVIEGVRCWGYAGHLTRGGCVKAGIVTGRQQGRSCSFCAPLGSWPARQADERSSSSIETPSGPRRKAMRMPGRMLFGSIVNSAPFALRSATMASMPVTDSPKWSRP